MPVVTPSAASIDTVKLVPCGEVLSRTIGAKPSWRQRSRVSERHTRPRACVTMKLMSPGRTSSAGMMRSPSFSRSSSSTITTMRPARSSSSNSGMLANVDSVLMGVLLGEQAFDVAGEHVDFQVDCIARLRVGEGGVREGVRDERDFEAAVIDGVDREAHAIHADRALRGDVAAQ